MGWRFQWKTPNCKTTRGKHRKKLLDIGFGKDFFRYDTKSASKKKKKSNTKQVGLLSH